MRKRLLAVGIATLILTLGWPVPDSHALGAEGHYFVAKWYARQIRDGLVKDAPDELKKALQDPVAFEAFCGGAMAPDFGAAELTHQGQNGDQARKMLAAAKDDLDKATTPEAVGIAMQEVAFSYGWMSHLAADDVAHPFINRVVGDSWRYLGAPGAKEHIRWEAVMDRAIYLAVDPDADPRAMLSAPILTTFARPFFGEISNTVLSARGVEAEYSLARATGLGLPSVMVNSLARILGFDDESMTPKEILDLLDTRFKPVISSYIEKPGTAGNFDRDSGRMTGEEYDKLRSKFIEYLGREPSGVLFPNLFEELAGSIRALSVKLVVSKAALEERLGRVQKAVAELDAAARQLQQFRRQADQVAADLRALLVEYVVLTSRPDFPKGMTAGPTSAPAPCDTLDDLAQQARDGRLTLERLNEALAAATSTLEQVRKQPATGELNRQAAALSKSLAAALKKYEDLGSGRLFAAVQATLAKRAANATLFDPPPADAAGPQVPLADLVAAFESQSENLSGQLRLVSVAPEGGQPPLFKDPDEPEASRKIEKWASEFRNGDLYTKTRSVDRKMIDSRLDALQARYDEAVALNDTVKPLIETATRSRSVVRPNEEALDAALSQIKKTEDCLAKLDSFKSRVQQTAAVPTTIKPAALNPFKTEDVPAVATPPAPPPAAAKAVSAPTAADASTATVKVVEKHFPNGQVQLRSSYYEGRRAPDASCKGDTFLQSIIDGEIPNVFYKVCLHGTQTQYFPSGAKQTEGIWVDGQKDGMWRGYCESGRLKEEYGTKGTGFEGSRRSWDCTTGVINNHMEYRNGDLVLEEEFWSKGQVRSRCEYTAPNKREGTCMSYDTDGKLIRTTTIKQ